MGNWFSGNFEESFPITIRNKNYGWKKDLPDLRDKIVEFQTIAKFVDKIDLRDSNLFPEIYDQGELGSCTANVLCTVFEYEYKLQFKDLEIKPSRLFLYYNERVITNTTEYDSGSSIRDSIKVINKLGVCNESKFPYKTNFFNVKPSVEAYLDAQKYKSVQYKKVKHNIICIKSALILRHPVSFGFTVYESFEDLEGVESTGVMKDPKENEKVLGGHTVLLCGYDDSKQLFLVRNSWGKEWGEGGYFWMSYNFLLSKSCSDFWIIEKIKKPNDFRTLADIVRGYQIRESEFEDSEDSDDQEDYQDQNDQRDVKGIVKSESKTSILEF